MMTTTLMSCYQLSKLKKIIHNNKRCKKLNKLKRRRSINKGRPVMFLKNLQSFNQNLPLFKFFPTHKLKKINKNRNQITNLTNKDQCFKRKSKNNQLIFKLKERNNNKVALNSKESKNKKAKMANKRKKLQIKRLKM